MSLFTRCIDWLAGEPEICGVIAICLVLAVLLLAGIQP